MADFSSIRKEDCRQVKLPDGCKLSGSKTVVLQSVLNAIKEHGRSSMHAEVCGVLTGSLCWDGGPYLSIDGRIEGKHASHQTGSVTFTSETWDYIHEELAAKHPGRAIVGWYHTHPGFGIFLSNMDAFIHDNFFSMPWNTAYVFDPQAETDGFFFRTEGNLAQEEVAVLPDVEPSVKKPQPGFGGPEKMVMEAAPKRRIVLSSVAAIALVLSSISILVLSELTRLRSEQEVEFWKSKVLECQKQIAISKREVAQAKAELEKIHWHLRNFEDHIIRIPLFDFNPIKFPAAQAKEQPQGAQRDERR